MNVEDVDRQSGPHPSQFAGGAVWYARGAKITAADAAEEAVGYQRSEVEPGRVVLRLRHIGGISYGLVNDGTDTAYGVHVDTGELGVGEQHTDYDELHSGQDVGFLLSPDLATTSRHVTVTWHERPDLSDEKRAGWGGVCRADNAAGTPDARASADLEYSPLRSPSIRQDARRPASFVDEHSVQPRVSAWSFRCCLRSSNVALLTCMSRLRPCAVGMRLTFESTHHVLEERDGFPALGVPDRDRAYR